MSVRVLVLSAVFLLRTPFAAIAFDVPVNDGFYTETIDILTDAQEAELEQTLTTYQQETSNEIAVLVVDSMSGADLLEAGVEVGRAWKVGAEGKDNGILIVAALQDRDITIQTGYGLEGAVPDIVVAGIIREDVAPYFEDGEYYEGLAAAIDSLKKHIGGEYTAERYEPGWDFAPGAFVFVMIFLNFIGAFLGRSKSWWLGGVLGGVFGIILTFLFAWWISIPIFVGLGFLFDYIVSRHGGRRGSRWTGGRWGGGGFGGGRGGGGFGGFGGGSFGGGGARGKW